MHKNSELIKRIVAAVIVLAAFAVGYYGYAKAGSTKSASDTIFAMDTYMELLAYGRNSEAAIQAAKEEITRLDELLSTGSQTSEVFLLNQNKTGIISDDTSYLIQRSLELYQESNGAFDITIYPVMQEWGFAGGSFQVPTQQRLDELLLYVDSSALELQQEQGQTRLTIPQSAQIDFGGIAKGYTSMRVAQIMEEYGIRSAMLNLGGNVMLIGEKPDTTAWNIAVRSPNQEEAYLGVAAAKGKAIITSGGYERYFEEAGETYHHIIDPETGRPANNGLQSVTIISEDATRADGLSTALYVMGTQEAIRFWQAHAAEFDAVLLTQDGTLYVTQGIAQDFTPAAGYEERMVILSATEEGGT